jgi:hypothetical protein
LAKIKFEKGNKKGFKGVEERGGLLDPANVSTKLKQFEVTKEELYEELARDWMNVEAAASHVPLKRQVKLLEKALTAPAFEDKKFPLRANDRAEFVYFTMLCKAKDTILYIQDILYDEMFKAEAERRKANEEGKQKTK